MFDKLNKLQEKAQKATERYATKLASAAEMERKRDTRRKIKLGAATLQMFEGGDLTLIDRFEQAITCGFDRRIDRLDFGLDDEDNWFDRMREEIRAKSARRLAANVESVPAPVPSAKPRPEVALVPASAPRTTAPAGGAGVSAASASSNGSATALNANA